MKTASIVLIIAFAFLPVFYQLIRLMYRLLAHRNENSAIIPSSTAEQPLIIKRRRKLYLTILVLYLIGMLFSIFFFIVQVVAPALDIPQQGMLFFGILMVILFGGSAIGIFFAIRYIYRKNPLPEKEHLDDKSVLDWENKYSDILSKKFFRWVLCLFGFIVVVVVLFGVIVEFTMW